MTKAQLKTAYVNWNRVIGKLSDRQLEIIREMQDLCEKNNCQRSCSITGMVEDLVKKGIL